MPPEVGRFALFVEHEGIKHRHELKDCQDAVFEETRMEGWI
jgi:hypothetical protein